MADKKLTMGQLAALSRAAAARVSPETTTKLRTIGQVGVGLMKREIQGLHAVDTGTMLNSTVVESVGQQIVAIGPTTDYASYVALGTRFMAARPFHTRASKQLDKVIATEFSDFEKDLGL